MLIIIDMVQFHLTLGIRKGIAKKEMVKGEELEEQRITKKNPVDQP